jgi:hypothetical protein
MSNRPRLSKPIAFVLFASAVLLLTATVAGAGTSLYKIKSFGALPSAYGWTYVPDPALNGPPEASIFSVSNGVLTQNTLAYWYESNAYQSRQALSPTKKFTLSMRARVLEEQEGNDPNNHFGFGVIAQTPDQCFGFGIGVNAIDTDCNDTVLTIDTTVFHDYLLKVTPGVGYELFVDKKLVATGPPRYVSGDSQVAFGDLTRGDGAHAEVMSFEFSQ